MGEKTSERSTGKVKSLMIVVWSNILVASITWILASRPQNLRNFTRDILDFSSGVSTAAAGVSTTAVDVDVDVDVKQQIQVLDYVPSRIESYFVEHGNELGLNVESPDASGCTEWNNATSPIAADLASFHAELNDYNEKMKAFPGTVKDLRQHITANNHSICDTLMLHPQGLKGIFPSGSLTQTAKGLVEPIVPPMRHPQFCKEKKFLMTLDYLVHDSPTYCRQLKRSSRIILIDMGAALDFHRDETSPAIYLTHVYQRFGFHFDHIYAFELRNKEPKDVFGRLPMDLFAAYHWINVGVTPEPDSSQNPWKMLLESYNEDDFGELTPCSSIGIVFLLLHYALTILSTPLTHQTATTSPLFNSGGQVGY